MCRNRTSYLSCDAGSIIDAKNYAMRHIHALFDSAIISVIPFRMASSVFPAVTPIVISMASVTIDHHMGSSNRTRTINPSLNATAAVQQTPSTSTPI